MRALPTDDCGTSQTHYTCVLVYSRHSHHSCISYSVVYDSPHLSNVIRQRAKIFVMCSVSFVTRESFLLSTSHVEQVGEMHDSARSDVGAVTTMQAQAAAAKQKPVGPTAVETYLFDLQGFLLLPAVLSPREVVALRTRLYELSVAL